MLSRKEAKERGTLGKLIFWGTIASGVVAAYLMYRRGASLTTIAKDTITNPVGALVTELKGAG